MYEEFILKIDAKKIIHEAIVATSGLPDNFSSLPVVNYICSSILLKLTGFLEQKFRALDWTLAYHNREYRYSFMREIHGEYSSYEDKQKVYKQLLKEITKFNTSFFIRHETVAKEVFCFIEKSFENTIFSSNLCRDFKEFKKELCEINFKKHKITEDPKTFMLIPHQSVKELFDNIIKERNQIAHNTIINKQTHMDIDELNKIENLNSHNIFIQIFVLTYIDNIFNDTYKIYNENVNRDY